MYFIVKNHSFFHSLILHCCKYSVAVKTSAYTPSTPETPEGKPCYDFKPLVKNKYKFKHLFLPCAPNSLDSLKQKKYYNKKTLRVQYHLNIHYPSEYTIMPLKTTKMAGRDAKTGRVIVGTRGGGVKRVFRWVDYKRIALNLKSPLVEKVLEIIRDPVRSGFIALVAGPEKARYIMATENMKPGDLVKTYGDIPRIPVRAKEGDAHPLGALPIGTKICCVEAYPKEGAVWCRAAGTFAVITKKIGTQVYFQLPHKHEMCVSEKCMATVGRIGNLEHSSIPIGSAQNLRRMGKRPRSGLWHRKCGFHGRKIHPLPPPRKYDAEKKNDEIKEEFLELTFHVTHRSQYIVLP